MDQAPYSNFDRTCRSVICVHVLIHMLNCPFVILLPPRDDGVAHKPIRVLRPESVVADPSAHQARSPPEAAGQLEATEK
ncbi:hypothetical protein Tco_1433788 [Tanacetum coccineum]